MTSAGIAVLGAVIVIAGGYLLQLGVGRAVLPADFGFLQDTTLAFYMISILPPQLMAAVVTKSNPRATMIVCGPI